MNKKSAALFSVGLLVVILIIVGSFHQTSIKNHFAMQTQQYENGQGTTFNMRFYKDAMIIPATERKMGYDEENPPKGNVITRQHVAAGLTFSIGKLDEIDESAREYCSKVERNVLSYKSKKTGERVPICLLGANNQNASHILYLTQVEGKKGRHLVQIFKDFDSNISKEQTQALGSEIDLRNDAADILYILSSIEEK